MHLKVTKKKKGFSLVETIIIFMIIIVISNISLKFILNIHLRSNEYRTYSDKKSLSIEEEEYLETLNIKIKRNSDSLNNLVGLSKEISNSNSNFKSYALEKINNKYYITKVKGSSKMYIGLDEINDKEYKFLPSTYKTQYIYGG
ncbi:MAG: hypothetical protein E6248_14555 [Clostridium sp.]|uniref:hypothetical protein n=1 Tax=Clostridium sp. TaxID=1506 RepID=UPI00290F5244|nr:hypothetical protein [Clostridium sp.]MDU5111661.1 hypothetical protein [Clostridium sp.]